MVKKHLDGAHIHKGLQNPQKQEVNITQVFVMAEVFITCWGKSQKLNMSSSVENVYAWI